MQLFSVDARRTASRRNEDAPGTGMVLRLTVVIAVGTLVAAGFRIFLGPVHPLAAWTIVGGLACYAGVPIVLRLSRSPHVAAAWLATSFSLFVIAFAYALGGLFAPLLSMFPVVALVVSVLVGLRTGWITAGGLVGVLVLFVYLDELGIAVPRTYLDSDSWAAGRAFFLSLAVLVVMAVSTFYQLRNRQLRARLEELAAVDALTGLGNRRYFDRALDFEWRLATRFGGTVSLILMDIDHFKPLNDHFGHQAGDECLAAVGQAIATTLRRRTDIAARYGGDEFVIVCPAFPEDDAVALADEISAAVRELPQGHPANPAGHVTLSCGVACRMPRDGEGYALLVEDADRALYEAKRAGRNRVVAVSSLDSPTT